MIRFKEGVSIKKLVGPMLLGLEIAEEVYKSFGAILTLTSGSEGHAGDGRHSQSSLHYQGEAVDLRIKDLAKEHWEPLALALEQALTTDFKVHREFDAPGGPHIHLSLRS